MTNKQIIDRLREAGHEVTGSPNRATLEALAAEKGVSLEEHSNSLEAPAPEAPAEEAPVRLITPVMAVCAIAGDTAAVAFPEVEAPE